MLLDERLELSNNLVERAVKELVIGRKNWLFSTSFKGARSSGIILSDMSSAKSNGLDCRKHLEYLFAELPNLSVLSESKALQDYLPWSSQVRAICSRYTSIKDTSFGVSSIIRESRAVLKVPHNRTLTILLKGGDFISLEFLYCSRNSDS